MSDYRRLPGPGDEHWSWQAQAACRGLQTTLFFHPEAERGYAHMRREAAAKAVCRRCPVIEACRRHALQVGEAYGIWGGLSAEEREHQLRGRRRVELVPGATSSRERQGLNAH